MNKSDRRNTAQHRRAHREYLRDNPRPTAQPWRSSKTTDIVSFNQGAEGRFVEWLAEKISQAETKTVTVGWILGNAAFELDVSVATIKRYLMKFTADAAPFASNGKAVTLRASYKTVTTTTTRHQGGSLSKNNDREGGEEGLDV